MQGKITEVLNFGTIVQVLAENDNETFSVNFDHRPFWNMVRAEGGDIIGREIDYDGKNVKFVEVC